MKKATSLLLAAITASLSVFAQPSKWFVSVSSGVPFGGPAKSIKNNMITNGLDQTSNVIFFFMEFSTAYPYSSQNPPLLFKLGKRITDKRSLYIVAGVSNSGEAVGNKIISYSGNGVLYPIFGGTNDLVVDVRYKLFQLGAGYQYSFHNTRAKVAVGPSVFIFKYENTSAISAQWYTAFVPGVAFSGRLPLGKEKRLIGVDLVTELNLAPPVKMKPLSTEATFDNKTYKAVLASSSVNMVHGMLGLALSIRR